MKKFFNLFFLVPLAIVLILLSVANRQLTSFSLDPLNTEAPAIAFELPLFVFLFVALILGMIIGSALTWMAQGKHRRALREKAYEANLLQREKDSALKEVPEKAPEEIAPGLPMVSRIN